MPTEAAPLAALRLSENAPAKVNLYLRLTGRRRDGYHLLDSLAVFAGIGDRLRAEAAPALTLAVDGPFAAALDAAPDNLVLRAARALAEAAGLVPGARLDLHKALPVASGIGGGSADAAASLRLLARLWDVPLVLAEAVAPELGADVPVCLAALPARMQGVGEALAPPPGLPEFGLLLANPGVTLDTASVFRARAASGAGFTPAAALPEAWPDAAAMAAGLAQLGNDLLPAAIALCPKIVEVLEALAGLPGVLHAGMSGSGATCFAIFATPAAAAAAAAADLPRAWWRWGGAPVAATS